MFCGSLTLSHHTTLAVPTQPISMRKAKAARLLRVDAPLAMNAQNQIERQYGRKLPVIRVGL